MCGCSNRYDTPENGDMLSKSPESLYDEDALHSMGRFERARHAVLLSFSPSCWRLVIKIENRLVRGFGGSQDFFLS